MKTFHWFLLFFYHHEQISISGFSKTRANSCYKSTSCLFRKPRLTLMSTQICCYLDQIWQRKGKPCFYHWALQNRLGNVCYNRGFDKKKLTKTSTIQTEHYLSLIKRHITYSTITIIILLLLLLTQRTQTL